VGPAGIPAAFAAAREPLDLEQGPTEPA